MLNRMTERKPGLTRREFDKVLTLGLGTFAGLPLQEYFRRNIKDLSFLDEAKEAAPLPAHLTGIHFNVPYLWERTQRQKDLFINFARKLTNPMEEEGVIHTVRVLPENCEHFIENKLGDVNEDQLDRLEALSDVLPRDFQMILPIIDGYWVFHSATPNPMYASADLTSAYLDDVSSRESTLISQMKFFTDKQKLDAFTNRIDAFVKRFAAKGNVILEIGNEVCMPSSIPDHKYWNSKWYGYMYNHIKSGYNGPILTGVSDPNQIDYSVFDDTESLVTTDHVYYPKLRSYPKDIPVIVEEIGVPKELYGQKFPAADWFLNRMMTGTIERSIKDSVARISSVSVWHADWWHHDNLNFDANDYPESAMNILSLAPKLRALAHASPNEL